VEGGEAIQEDLALLRMLYRLGVRSMTLTWNQRNAIGDGAAENPNGGLSKFGLEVVAEMNRLGMLVDVSHLNWAGFWDVVKHSKAPVIASHSNARKLCNHPRNLDDDQIKALADNGGVMCITFVPAFLKPQNKRGASIQDIICHIDYVKKLVGPDHIGIGSDFDGTDEMPEGLENASKMPALAEALLLNGYRESEIEKILGGNILKLLECVLK